MMTARVDIPTWQQFALDSVQVALYTPEHGTFRTSRAVASILGKFAELFDGEMQVLPLGSEGPAEFPRVLLAGAEGHRQLQIGPERFNLVQSPTPHDVPSTLPGILESSLAVAQHYVKQNDVPVGRLALVVRRVCPSEQPAQVLIDRFCNDSSRREPFNRSSTFEIHNHKQYQPAAEGIDYAVNSWVRCTSATSTTDSRPVILVHI